MITCYVQDLNINLIPLIEVALWTDSESDSDEESDDQEEEEEKDISVESKQGIIDIQMLQESWAVLSWGSEWEGPLVGCRLKFSNFVGSRFKFSIFVGSRLNVSILVDRRKISVNK